VLIVFSLTERIGKVKVDRSFSLTAMPFYFSLAHLDVILPGGALSGLSWVPLKTCIKHLVCVGLWILMGRRVPSPLGTVIP
jgi:hypothetical protein